MRVTLDDEADAAYIFASGAFLASFANRNAIPS